MASKYSKRFTVPEGFTDILHNLTREVLRDSPDDVVEYAALYFEALRDNKPFHYESKYNVEVEEPQSKVETEKLAVQAEKQELEQENFDTDIKVHENEVDDVENFIDNGDENNVSEGSKSDNNDREDQEEGEGNEIPAEPSGERGF